jgi:hypothetical protein
MVSTAMCNGMNGMLSSMRVIVSGVRNQRSEVSIFSFLTTDL